MTYGFPLVRDLKHVGGGHIMGTDLQGRTEITWNAFATDRPVGDVVAYYRSKLGDEGMEGDVAVSGWDNPPGTSAGGGGVDERRAVARRQ